MSTAWYKPNRIPKRIRYWISSSSSSSSSPSASEIIINQKNHQQQYHHQHQRRSIEVWDTTCIVTNMNYSLPKNDDNNNSNSNSNNKNDDDNKFSILINPGNPSLSGVSKFSYFPVGGPEPSEYYSNVNNKNHKDSHPIMGYVTQWGGMDVGNGMMFSSNTIDGLVHQYGGKALKEECERVMKMKMKMKRKMRYGSGNDNETTSSSNSNKNNGQRHDRIDEGTAIQTNVVGQKLIDISGYKKLIHTVPPFFNNHNHHKKNNHNKNDDANVDNDDDNDNVDDVEFLLAECYRNSLDVATTMSSSSSSSIIPMSTLTSSTNNDNNNNNNNNNDNNNNINLRIACPLLGAGCRGFPIDRAIQIAAKTTVEWMTMTVIATTTINSINNNADNNTTNVNDYVTNTNMDVTDNVMTGNNNTTKKQTSSSSSSSTSISISSSSWWWRWFDGGKEEVEEIDIDIDNGKYKYKYYKQEPQSVTIAFGIPDGEIRKRLIEAIDQEMEKKERYIQ